MSRLYSALAVDDFLDKIYDHGAWDLHQIDEGTLGCGTWICEPIKEGFKWIVIKEVYLNEWSSAHTVSKRVKLTKQDQELFDNYMNDY